MPSPGWLQKPSRLAYLTGDCANGIRNICMIGNEQARTVRRQSPDNRPGRRLRADQRPIQRQRETDDAGLAIQRAGNRAGFCWVYAGFTIVGQTGFENRMGGLSRQASDDAICQILGVRRDRFAVAALLARRDFKTETGGSRIPMALPAEDMQRIGRRDPADMGEAAGCEPIKCRFLWRGGQKLGQRLG